MSVPKILSCFLLFLCGTRTEAYSWECYSWTAEDLAYINGNISREKQRCESDPYRVFSQGNNVSYPGCGNCWCCHRLDTNDCDPNPCKNGAACINGQNLYTCTCQRGWTGKNCDVTTYSWECYSWTAEDLAYISISTEKQRCESDPYRVFSQGNNVSYPGCDGCWCCHRLDINDCDPNPCKNDAACTDGQYKYTCTCQSGWTGTDCDVDINECGSNQCKNGTTCIDGQNMYTCPCQLGWTGKNCDVDIDECDPNPCKNGAACINGQNMYKCTCQPGWTGKNCEVDINECDPNPCKNGATCIHGQNAYTCTCKPGWTGIECEVDINECDPNPCKDGAACIDWKNEYTCTCQPGLRPYINECDPFPCKDGAACIDGQNEYKCTCQLGWTGMDCDVDIKECDSSSCKNGAAGTDGQYMYTCILALSVFVNLGIKLRRI